tara:strand:+ start:38 stop:412 length:375 start_codon:yes stop_codon:yes gene_type:complete
MSANLDNGVILGALGSSFSNTTDILYPPTGMVIVSIQFIGKTGITTLTPEDHTARIAAGHDKFFNTETHANNMADADITVDEGGGGDILPGTAFFEAGMVIYGRWTVVQFNSHTAAGAICYFGY